MRKDEKGVSPVIGVILMVAITVILAAVIASFVFGMSGTVTKPKTPGLSLKRIDTDTISVVITDMGGADKLTNCKIYDLQGNEKDSSTDTLDEVGDVTIIEGVSYGNYRLICEVDGVKQIVWEGAI
ncbi:MAG: type IV pilin N-terminal domain-containing protein [Archaeoglobales archaeon]|nr:type IV pilin N-terminal domain-containing protein [Archaeoglobales archaeon]